MPLLLSLFCLAIYPILGLFAYNRNFVRLTELPRPLLLVLLLAAVVYFIARLVIKNVHKAFLVSVVFLGLFFSYGHVYYALKSFARHRFLAPIWIFLFVLAVWLILKKIQNPEKITDALKIISIVLLIYPILQVAPAYLATNSDADSPVTMSASEDLPDIYYIILDGYSRADILAAYFDFDNSEFIDALRERGFYVADCSQTNYSWTHLSMTSALNMRYLDSQNEAYYEAFGDAAIWTLLKDAGYEIIVFDSGYSRSMTIDADVLIQDDSAGSILSNVTEFESMVMQTSVGLLVMDSSVLFQDRFADVIADSRHNRIYYKTLNTLEGLKSVSTEYDSPKFVYAHIVPPHDPYIFGPDGEYISKEPDLITGYTNSIRFLNPRIIAFVDAILAESEKPPVIILQSDHGWPKEEKANRITILNAYYLPGGGEEGLYETITPVNSFRYVFNYYWGTDYELLEDVSRYSTKLNAPLEQFEIVPNRCPSQ